MQVLDRAFKRDQKAAIDALMVKWVTPNCWFSAKGNKLEFLIPLDLAAIARADRFVTTLLAYHSLIADFLGALTLTASQTFVFMDACIERLFYLPGRFVDHPAFQMALDRLWYGYLIRDIHEATQDQNKLILPFHKWQLKSLLQVRAHVTVTVLSRLPTKT